MNKSIDYELGVKVYRNSKKLPNMMILILTILLQGCVSSRITLTETDCTYLYRKGWTELKQEGNTKRVLEAFFPETIVAPKENRMTKWFTKSKDEVAVCKAFPDDDGCGTAYLFFYKRDEKWEKGDQVITICGGHPR